MQGVEQTCKCGFWAVLVSCIGARRTTVSYRLGRVVASTSSFASTTPPFSTPVLVLSPLRNLVTFSKCLWVLLPRGPFHGQVKLTVIT